MGMLWRILFIVAELQIIPSIMGSIVSTISNRACFGAGCYWGTEKFIKSDFGGVKGAGTIVSGAVGFMGPPSAKPNPSYREVCSGRTGYVEVYDFTFDGDYKTYEDLIRHFFSFHDPTTKDKQGNDIGTQYSSVIFYYDEKQKMIAEKVKVELQSYLDKGRNPYLDRTVTTDIRPATVFYKAQEDHQEYLEKNPRGYCNHGYRQCHSNIAARNNHIINDLVLKLPDHFYPFWHYIANKYVRTTISTKGCINHKMINTGASMTFGFSR
eukprot:gene8411-17332_t